MRGRAHKVFKTHFIFAGLLCLFITFHSASAFAAWFDSNWSYRKQITFDPSMTPSDQSDFPAMVYKASDAKLASSACTNGEDILFTDSDGTTQLDHEIEEFNEVSGELTAWVEMPALYGSLSTIIYIYYGDSRCIDQQNIPGTWDEGGTNNYKAVWHLDEDQANKGNPGLYKDSAGPNYHHGNDEISATSQDSYINGGITHGGQDFNGTDDYIEIADHNELDLTGGSFTISAWVNARSFGETVNGRIIDHGGGSGGSGGWSFLLFDDAGEKAYAFYSRNGLTNNVTLSNNNTVNLNQWEHVAVTMSGGAVNFYIDGIASGTNPGTPNPTDRVGGLRIGRRSTDNFREFDGFIDEVRVATTPRTLQWIQTEFNNQNDPDAYLTFGPETVRYDLELHPSGAAIDDQMSSYTGGTAATALDTNDGNTSYGQLGAAIVNARLELDDTSQSGTILSVQIYTVLRDILSEGGDQIKIGLRTNGTQYLGPAISNIGNYALYSGTLYETNPNTGSAWTWSEIDNLDAIVHNNNGEVSYNITELYAAVAYTFSPTTTIGDGTGPASRNVWAGGRLFGVDVFTTQTSSGTDTLTDLTITFDGTNVSDVVNGEVKLWKDNGSFDNEWDITDTYIDTAELYDVNDAKFTGLTEAIGTTATRYIITYDIEGSATPGHILRGEVTDATVTNTLVEDDNVDATLTVQADSVHETSIYKAVYSPGSLEELYIKGSGPPLSSILDGMSLGSLYSDGMTPGSLLISSDPDTTVTTSVSNSAVKHVQMSGRLMHPSGNQYGTVDTDIAFHEDRIVFDVTIDVTFNPPGAPDWMFMTYGQWGSDMSNNFKYSSNLGPFTDQVADYSSSGETEPISYQTFFELGATDGLVNATMQSISGFNPAGFKNDEIGGGSSYDVAFQLTVPVSTHHTSVQYSFDTTTSGLLNATLAEQRQNDFVTPAAMNFSITDGDGSVVGDGYEELRGAYTLSDGDADDHVRFQFEPTTTHHAPVFEISAWGSGAPSYIDVGGVMKSIGTDYNVAVNGGVLYLQYLSNISAITIIEIPSSCPGFVVTTTADTGSGSLRACITLANSNPGADTITFNIPGGSCPGGVCTVSPSTVMTINDASGGTTIDGYTQAGAVANTAAFPAALNGTLAIELDGSSAGAVDGLMITSANNVIQGLVINGFNSASKSAINIDGASATGNTISGIYLGTNVSGTAPLPNDKGIQIGNGASGNTIGGNTASERNIISGNSNGIVISGIGTDDTVIQGNFVGIDATGTAAVANTPRGIWITGGDNTKIGGAGSGEGNIISANSLTGISLWQVNTSNTTIYGNIVGTGATRTETNLGNGWYAVEAMTGASGTILGGVSSGQENELAYSGKSNVWIVGTVGAGTEVKGNNIHDAGWDGIRSEGADILITKNLVRDNTLRGIYLYTEDADDNKIYHNTIHGNTDDGVEINDNGGASGITGTIIKNNIITSNGVWGIDNSNGSTITNDYNNVPASPTAQGNTSGSCTGCSLGSGSLSVDPLYNNEPGDDYTLTECTSPAINMACNLGAATDDTFCDSASDGEQPDLVDGTGSPLSTNFNNNAPDMGAYETGNCVPGLTIVKQVWEEGGTTPLGNPTAPVGATLVFLIYVKNTTAGTVSDLRINDDLDEAGFEYIAGSLVRTVAGSPPSDTATDKQIFDATASGIGTDLFDPVDGDVASAQDTADLGTDVDKITIGAVFGQANATLSIDAHKTFALRFEVKVK